jgi:hypothetical protein
MPKDPAKPPKRATAAQTPKAKAKGAATPPKAPEPVKKKIGRPTIFTKLLGDIICTRIAEGESLREIIKSEGMPDRTVVYDWLLKDPEFANRYARARDEQADTLADEIIAIADEQPEIIAVVDKKTGALIEHKLDGAFLQWQKNRIDARKWTAMKLKPKKYGDKLALGGDEGNPIKVEAEVQAQELLGTLLKNIELKRQADVNE